MVASWWQKNSYGRCYYGISGFYLVDCLRVNERPPGDDALPDAKEFKAFRQISGTRRDEDIQQRNVGSNRRASLCGI